MHSLTEMSQKQHFTKYGFWAYKDHYGYIRIYVPKCCVSIELAMIVLNLLPAVWKFGFHSATLESFGDKDTR